MLFIFFRSIPIFSSGIFKILLTPYILFFYAADRKLITQNTQIVFTIIYCRGRHRLHFDKNIYYFRSLEYEALDCLHLLASGSCQTTYFEIMSLPNDAALEKSA